MCLGRREEKEGERGGMMNPLHREILHALIPARFPSHLGYKKSRIDSFNLQEISINQSINQSIYLQKQHAASETRVHRAGRPWSYTHY